MNTLGTIKNELNKRIESGGLRYLTKHIHDIKPDIKSLFNDSILKNISISEMCYRILNFNDIFNIIICKKCGIEIKYWHMLYGFKYDNELGICNTCPGENHVKAGYDRAKERLVNSISNYNKLNDDILFDMIKSSMSESGIQGIEKYIRSNDINLYKNIINRFDDSILSCEKFTEKLYRIIFIDILGEDLVVCQKCGMPLSYYSFNIGFKCKYGECSKNAKSENLKSRWIRLLGDDAGIKRWQLQCDNAKGRLSLDWFIEKYGKIGQDKYQKYWEYNFSRRSTDNYSKKSQKLFWEIYKNLSKINKEYTMFAELNREKRFNFNNLHRRLMNNNSICMFMDFCIGKDVVIEFDGDYWHMNTEDIDIAKTVILQDVGYRVLRIKECDWDNNQDRTIKECLDFIDETKYDKRAC